MPLAPVTQSTPDPDQLQSVTALPADDPARVVLEVIGEVDAYTAPLLEACLQSQSGRGDVRELAVDLEQVSLPGAAGGRQDPARSGPPA